jgi:hypothetical protein
MLPNTTVLSNATKQIVVTLAPKNFELIVHNKNSIYSFVVSRPTTKMAWQSAVLAPSLSMHIL